MSHLTVYKSKVLTNTNPIILEKALKDLNIELDSNIKRVANSFITENVDAGFVINNKPVSLGIKYIVDEKTGNQEVTITGDFWRTGVDQGNFINKLSQLYKKYDVIEKCEQQGWNVSYDDIVVDAETDEIVIQAYRYVV